MPSSQVSRNALICSGWRVASSALPSLTSRLRVLTCQLRAELDAVGRVDVDHLDLALEPLLLGEAGHHQQRVAEDHPVGPVLRGAGRTRPAPRSRQAVEVGEQVELRVAGPDALGRPQVLDDAPGAGSSPGCRPARPAPRGRRASCSSLPFQTSCGSRRRVARVELGPRAGGRRLPRTTRSSAVGMFTRWSPVWRVASTGMDAAGRGSILRGITSLRLARSRGRPGREYSSTER